MTKQTEAESPPQDLRAEQNTLGVQLLGGEAVEIVRQIISAADYWSDIHRMIQGAIFDVYDTADGKADVLLVQDKLRRSGQLQEVGGIAYLTELLESVYFVEHAAQYADIVARFSRRRKADTIGRELSSQARNLANDDREVVEAANEAAMKMAELLNVKNSRPRPIKEHVFETIETYRKGQTPAVFWGIPDIDQMIGGVMPGELIVIGARPSMGKSLVALQWLDCASRIGIPGLIISEEMSATSLANRNLSTITDIPSEKWNAQADRIEFEAKEHFKNSVPVLVVEKCGTVAAAERAIARAVQSHGVRIVAVDYAQLLKGNGDTKEQRVGDVSARMKSAAMKHDIVVLLLAQLNRQIESRPNPIPQLSDLRDSGGLEQDADVVLFPFWPLKLNDEYKDRTEYRVYCRKNRNRGIGESCVVMRINPARQRLEPSQHSNDGMEGWS